MSAILAADGDRAWFDVRAGCNSDASGRGPCYMDLVFNNLVLGHRAKNWRTLLDFAVTVAVEGEVADGGASWQIE